jgi:hypothetical protein
MKYVFDDLENVVMEKELEVKLFLKRLQNFRVS